MCLFLRDIKFRFGDKLILKGITVKFEKGLNLIVGESGSGKTTFLKTICQLLKFEGQMLFGKEPVDEKWTKKNCALVKQSGFYTEETILDTVKKPFEFKFHRSKKLDVDELKKLMELFGLSKFSLDDKTGKLSGGELQRLALIRAILLEPKLFLADEPTSNLDPYVSKNVYSFLKGFCKQRVCVVVSHDPIAGDFSDKTFVFEGGKLSD